MAAKKLSMRKTREILRLYFVVGLSTREIARSCNVGRSTAHEYVGRAKVARLDDALDKLLFPSTTGTQPRPAPLDFGWIHRELRRKHVTKQLLWEEYRAQYPNGYGYSQFCQLYLDFSKTFSVTMRQNHKAGEKMFVDFSGDGITIHDRSGGQARTAKLFLAVLGASNMTYVEAVLHEDLATWTGCHVRAFEYFGGVAEITVPDNLKRGVTKPDYYDPEINKTYGEMGGTTIIPARVRKPRDKAKVEQGVLLAERWIIAVLRHRRFCSLAEVQQAIAPLREKLNGRRLQKLNKSRREVFDEVEREALRPLPSKPYEFSHWKKVRINIDYHIEYDRHYYSVPYILARSEAEVRATANCIEVLVNNKRVASHARRFDAYKVRRCSSLEFGCSYPQTVSS
jgi:transposase